MSDLTEILTAPEAAAYLRVSTRTLASLRATGGGPAYSRLLGQRSGIRYLRSDLDLYVRSCRMLVTGIVEGADDAS